MLITNLANNGYRPVISIVQSAPLMLIIRTLTLIDFRISGPVSVSARVQVEFFGIEFGEVFKRLLQ